MNRDLGARLTPSARRYKSSGSANTTTLNTQTDIVLDTDNFNRAPSYFDLSVTNSIKVLIAGLYLVTVDCAFTSVGSGYRGSLLLVNGSLLRENGFITTECRPGIVCTADLAVNDTLKLAYYVTGASAVTTISTLPKDIGLCVTRLGI